MSTGASHCVYLTFSLQQLQLGPSTTLESWVLFLFAHEHPQVHRIDCVYLTFSLQQLQLGSSIIVTPFDLLSFYHRHTNFLSSSVFVSYLLTVVLFLMPLAGSMPIPSCACTMPLQWPAVHALLLGMFTCMTN
jgi:hypothetical protein